MLSSFLKHHRVISFSFGPFELSNATFKRRQNLVLLTEPQASMLNEC